MHKKRPVVKHYCYAFKKNGKVVTRALRNIKKPYLGDFLFFKYKLDKNEYANKGIKFEVVFKKLKRRQKNAK